MKFLCVSGGLVDSPSDDILYEVQMHESMQTIGPLDMQIGFTVEKRGMMAVVLHPLPGNVRDSMPKMDVSPQAFQHGVWIRGGIFPWNDMKASSPALHDIRVLTPTAKQPAILTSLGNILLMSAGQVTLGNLVICAVDPTIPDPSCELSISSVGKPLPPAAAPPIIMPVLPITPLPPLAVATPAAPPIDSSATTTHSVADSKPFGIPKKAITKKALPRVPHVKRSIGKVAVADPRKGMLVRTYSKGDLGTLIMAFSEKVAPGEVLFERNVFPSRPTMMRMTYQNDAGKKKLHKSFSDLLDWLHAKQPLNFYIEMRTKCMDYLSPSDLASLGQPPMQPSTPNPTASAAASASPHGDEADLLLASDSEDDDELVVGSDAEED